MKWVYGVIGLVTAAIIASILLGGGGYEPAAKYRGSERDFLVAIHSRAGMDWGADDAAIKTAHLMCELRGEGYSVDALVNRVTLGNRDVSAGSVRFFVDTAVTAYCPKYG